MTPRSPFPLAPGQLALAACWMLAVSAGPQGPSAQEPDLKRAAMLRASVILKLAPYLAPDMPPEQRPPRPFYRIAVVGTDDVATAIVTQLPGKKVEQSVVQVTEITEVVANHPTTPPTYELLYIADTVDDKVVAKIVAAHQKQPVVLVCEHAAFAKGGGTVQLFVQDNSLRFEVNAEALKAQGLRANPQLLKLSRRAPQ